MMTIVLLILAYLLGSIPSGLWIGQIFFNINLREHGSGNTGTTNTFRILGTKAGLASLRLISSREPWLFLLPTIFGGFRNFSYGLWSFSSPRPHLPYFLQALKEARQSQPVLGFFFSHWFLSCFPYPLSHSISLLASI